jgi:uncharacterized protein YdeI (BOF family)
VPFGEKRGSWRAALAQRLQYKRRIQTSPEDLMKKRTQSLWMLGALALAMGTATLQAQQSDPSQTPSTPPSDQQQQQQPPAGQNGDAQSAQPSSDGSQTFSGTIVKSGDKYVLQDASGKNYDIDRQDGLKQYEGKQVRVKGTLDADGKTIHMK